MTDPSRIAAILLSAAATPWSAEDSVIRDANGVWIGAIAHAALIVAAVNAHADLLDLAKNLLTAIEKDKSIGNRLQSDDIAWFRKKARAAIAKATETGR